MISSVSWVSRQTGQASTSANFLNSAALPSITGSAAGQGLEGGRDVLGVAGRHGVAGDVDDDPVGVRLDHVERRDHTADLADRARQIACRAGGRRRLDANGDRVTRTWYRHAVTL